MELTPEVQPQVDNLDKLLVHTHTIRRLEENDASIVASLDEMKEDIDSRFDKGAKRMDITDEKVDNVDRKVDGLADQMKLQHGEIMAKMDQKENERLKEELLKAIESKRSQDNRIWDVTKIIIGGALTLLIAGYMVATGLK